MIRAALLAVLILAAPAAHADTTTANFKFIIPATGSFNWAAKVNDWMVKVDTGVAGLLLPNTYTAFNAFAGISASTITASSVTINANGALPVMIPNAPLQVTGNINGYLQIPCQNQSNGTAASCDFVGFTDLGGDATWYFDLGINSSKYSQAAYSILPASATYLYASDSRLYLGANANKNPLTNGGITFWVNEAISSDTVATFEASSATFYGAGGVKAVSFQGSSATFTNGMSCSSCTVYGAGGLTVFSSATFGNPTGAAPPPSLVLFSSGTNGGSLFNPMTTAQKNLLPVATLSSGTIVFDITTDQYNYWNGSAWTALGSGGGVTIATGPTSGIGSTKLPAETTAYFDSTFFTAVDSPTIGATILSLKNVGGITSAPTHKYYTSASNLAYTPDTGISVLHVKLWGQGGGGGAFATNSGTAGSSTTWVTIGSTIAANGGGGGTFGASGAPGAGGNAGIGGFGIFASSSVTRSPGQPGIGGATGSASWMTANGGASGCGGGGGIGSSAGAGGNAPANSGGGGAGGSSAGSGTGASGAGGECVDMWITVSPGTVYYITVGSLGGQGGTAGTAAGGNAGTGGLTIDEYYGTQGFAAPASSVTVVPNGTTTQTTYALAYATVTITTSGAPVLVCFNGQIEGSASTNDVGWSVLVNGGYGFNGLTATSGVFDSNLYAGTGHIDASTCKFFTGIPAGSNSFGWSPASIAGATTLKWGTSLTFAGGRAPNFYAIELKNTAGTGDVSSNGTNVFSGANQFTGVEASTISVNLSGLTIPTQSIFAVAVETLTYVVGPNPFEVDYDGAMFEIGSGPYLAWSFLVDGQYIDGLSSTNGVLGVLPAGSTDNDMTAHYPVKAGVVSQGSHKFALTAHCFNNTACLFGGHSSSRTSQAKFSVRAIR